MLSFFLGSTLDIIQKGYAAFEEKAKAGKTNINQRRFYKIKA
jgi:hypothetical protein